VPEVYGGLPNFANPGSTFYPFRFLADAIFPSPRSGRRCSSIQFGLGGLGTYLLARELGTRRWVAFVAGLAFEFTGVTLSWVFAGHEGRIIVATFAPLAFYFVHAGVRTVRVAPFAGLALCVSFSLLSFQLQTAYYLLIAVAIWAAFCMWHLGSFQAPAGGGAHAGVRGAVHRVRLRERVGHPPPVPRLRGTVAARRAGARLRVLHLVRLPPARDHRRWRCRRRWGSSAPTRAPTR
jgi:hypothetical protein